MGLRPNPSFGGTPSMGHGQDHSPAIQGKSRFPASDTQFYTTRLCVGFLPRRESWTCIQDTRTLWQRQHKCSQPYFDFAALLLNKTMGLPVSGSTAEDSCNKCQKSVQNSPVNSDVLPKLSRQVFISFVLHHSS